MEQSRVATRHSRVSPRLAALALPVLLLLVAGVQRYRAATDDQSSWSGAGFGMFATVNQERAGFLRAELVSPGGTTPVTPPTELARDIIELKADPVQSKLDALAKRWLTIERGHDPSISEIHVALWHVTFSSDGPHLESYPLREAVAT